VEPECKKFRLMADVFNDLALIIDCLSPMIPKEFRIGAWCGSSVLRSMCGVSAGSSKASLSAHFAKCGNLGELNAVSRGVLWADQSIDRSSRKMLVRRLSSRS
jgi:hypothetical protein